VEFWSYDVVRVGVEACSCPIIHPCYMDPPESLWDLTEDLDRMILFVSG